jgi:hypothetical protein
VLEQLVLGRRVERGGRLVEHHAQRRPRAAQPGGQPADAGSEVAVDPLHRPPANGADQ